MIYSIEYLIYALYRWKSLDLEKKRRNSWKIPEELYKSLKIPKSLNKKFAPSRPKKILKIGGKFL